MTLQAETFFFLVFLISQCKHQKCIRVLVFINLNILLLQGPPGPPGPRGPQGPNGADVRLSNMLIILKLLDII